MSYFTRDGRFSFDRRSGLVTFVDGVQHGMLSVELLAASRFDMAVRGENCRWTEPDPRRMTRDEARLLVRQFAAAVYARIDLVFSDEHVDIRSMALSSKGPSEVGYYEFCGDPVIWQADQFPTLAPSGRALYDLQRFSGAASVLSKSAFDRLVEAKKRGPAT